MRWNDRIGCKVAVRVLWSEEKRWPDRVFRLEYDKPMEWE